MLVFVLTYNVKCVSCDGFKNNSSHAAILPCENVIFEIFFVKCNWSKIFKKLLSTVFSAYLSLILL